MSYLTRLNDTCQSHRFPLVQEQRQQQFETEMGLSAIEREKAKAFGFKEETKQQGFRFTY